MGKTDETKSDADRVAALEKQLAEANAAREAAEKALADSVAEANAARAARTTSLADIANEASTLNTAGFMSLADSAAWVLKTQGAVGEQEGVDAGKVEEIDLNGRDGAMTASE